MTESLKKVEKMTFSDYYYGLSDSEKKDIREDFLQETGLSYPTFFSKLSRGNFSLLERRFLSERCNKEFSWS